MKNSSVFIVGKPRTGTTFLWSFLAGFDKTQPFTRVAQKPDGRWLTSESGCFLKNYFAGVELFKTFQRKHPDKVVVEKSPEHIRFVNKLAVSFPTARFIVTSRDANDAYASYNKHWPIKRRDYDRQMSKFNIPKATRKYLTNSGRLLDITFDELKEPEVLKTIARFAGLPTKEKLITEALTYAESRPVDLLWAQNKLP